MTYTAPEIVLIISALGGIIVNIVVAIKTSGDVGKTLTKTSVIEGHVNSRETKYNEQITALQNENKLLKDQIAAEKQSAMLLAQAAILRGRKADKVMEEKGNK